MSYNLPNSESNDFSVGSAPHPSDHVSETDLRAEYGDLAGYDSYGILRFITGIPPELCGECDDPNLDNSPSRAWAEYAADELDLQVYGYLSSEPQNSDLKKTGKELYETAVESEEVYDPPFKFKSHEDSGKARIREA